MASRSIAETSPYLLDMGRAECGVSIETSAEDNDTVYSDTPFLGRGMI